MTVARRFIAGVRDYMACVPEGRLNSERGAEIFTSNLSEHAGFVATQNQLQASLRDADLIDGQPGDKSPGYYRVSLRDEVPGKASLERTVP